MTKLDWRKASIPNPDPARVIDVGWGWAKVAVTKARKRKETRRRKLKPNLGQLIQIQPLIISRRRANLIASIMKEAGKPLPSRHKKLNARLRTLIDEGVITPEGLVNKKHPTITEWFEKVSRRESD